MPTTYLNIELTTLKIGKRIRVKPLAGQSVSPELFVACSRKQRSQMSEGIIFKSDVRLVEPKAKKAYLKATNKAFGQLKLF